jgi:hypothetical protein
VGPTGQENLERGRSPMVIQRLLGGGAWVVLRIRQRLAGSDTPGVWMTESKRAAKAQRAQLHPQATALRFPMGSA